MKYYAVKKGIKPGIYLTWNECQEQTKSFSGAIFKSFDNEKDAINFLNSDTNVTKNNIQKLPQKDEIFAYVDGSFNKETFEYGYGVALIDFEENIITLNGKDNKKEVVSMRNVAGELKGAMLAVSYVVKNYPNIRKIKIFHDYMGISEWVKGTWKTNLEYTQKYKEYMLKMNEKINISFEKVTAHKGIKYNEMVDKLAKDALGI